MLKKLLVLLISFFIMIPHSFVTFAENAEESEPAEIIEKEPLTVQPMADEEKDIRDISVDETVTVNIENGGDMIYYRFVPETSNMYMFVSMSNEFDTYGYLYDENFNELTSNDDGAGNSNFRVKYQLEAGVTYYFAARMYNSEQTGSFEAKLSVYEPTAAEELSFKRDSYGLRLNNSQYIPSLLNIQPYLALEDTVFTSSDETVIEVSGSYVNAKAAGEATLTATSSNGITASTLVKVGNYADSISQVSDYEQDLTVGQTVQLTYKLYPEDGDLSDETVIWTTNGGNPDCISLDQEGNITAISAGYTNVYAEISNGSTASWYIYISEPLTSLSFRNETNYLAIGGGNHIWNYLNYEPDEAYGSALTIESSDESIIKVDGSYLYGVAKGTAEITVTSANDLSATGTFEIGNYADGINPKEGNIRLKVGETKQLEYILYPEDRDTSDEVIRWEIDYSDNNSFSLSETGEVTALNTGSGAVRAYIKNGGNAYYSITVYEEPTSLSFRKDTNYIGQNDGQYLWNFLNYEPSGAYRYPLNVTSGDESIVRIDGEYLYGVNKGTTTITVSAENGVSASAEFTVGDYASSISRSGDYETYVKVGESKQLPYQLYPYNGTFDDEEIIWSLSYGATNVSVDESGVVTGLRTGYAEIRATIKNGSSTYFYVHVYQDPEALSFRKSTNYLDKYYSYNVEGYLNYEPSSAYGTKLNVTSSNPEVVGINDKQLFGRTNGTATITVTAENGVSASAEFVVGDFAASISNIEMNSIYLTPGESKQLAYQLYPENTEFADESVTWSIESDPNGAITIDSTGLVKAVKTGYAQVKAAIKNGSYANYYISVVPEPKKIAFADMNYYVAVGSSKYINNSMLISNPAGAQWTQAEYTSSNESVMTVQDSMIRGVSVGTAILTATAEEDLVAKTRIHVGNYASSIEPKGERRRTLKVGDSVQLEYNLYGNGDYSDDEFIWQLNYADDNCIRLSETGQVTALTAGTAQVSVTGKTGAAAYFFITVADQPTSISFEQSEYTAVVGKEIRILADVTPESASLAQLNWESSDSSIARVSYSYNSCYVYGCKEGTVTIKAYSAENESVYAECTVNVIPTVPATSISIAPTAAAYVDYTTMLIYSTEPFNGDPNVTLSADNDNITFAETSSGSIWVRGVKKGTSVLTLTSADGKVTASTTITVKEGYPDMEGSWYIGHRNPTNGTIYNYRKDPTEYLFVKGESYYVDTETVYTPYAPVNRIDLAKRLTDTGLFENAFMTGYGGSDIFAYNAAHATASKAGTAEVELINGKKIKVTVIDAAWLGAKTTADSSIPADIVNAFKEYDFGMQYDTTFYAAEINGLDSLSVNANQKAVVQSRLDVSIDEYEKDALGNIRFVFTATPKVKVVSMAKTADSASNGTDLIAEQTLTPYADLDVVVPTAEIFGDANVRNLKVTQKVNGTDFNYESDNFLYDDGMIVIRSENGAGQFTIIGTASSYKDPVYTWTETADGYEVTATAESDEGEPTITETVKAVYSVEKEALCTTTGIGVYTATFTNAVFETQTKRVTIPAIGHHEYGEPEYTWSRDNKTATAKAVCTVCGDEVTETVNTTYEVLEEPTLEEPGKGKYTAVFTNELFETQTKEVEIPSLSDKSAKDIVLDKNELTILFNASEKLNATVLPEDCEDKTVKWSSSDTSIVTVDANGNVKGVKPGKATVTAETVNGLTDTCEVRVLFTDVAVSSQYFFTPVYWAVDNGITVGAGGPGKFSPTASCTREQFVTFLWRLNGEPEPKSSSNFSDVKTSDWYYKPITWAAENGITVGLNDGTGRFGVGQKCTRGMLVTFLYRFDQSK